jgi:hypothetical protein
MNKEISVDSVTVAGIFVLGAAAGALESLVRSVMTRRLSDELLEDGKIDARKSTDGEPDVLNSSSADVATLSTPQRTSPNHHS